MSINKEWHARNKMPKNPTMEQRIKWHIAHQENCSCRSVPPKLAAVIRKRREKAEQG